MTLFKPDRVTHASLPDEVTGRHWLYDSDSSTQTKALACIEAVDGHWELSTLGQARIAENDQVLSPDGGQYHLTLADGTDTLLFIESQQTAGSDYQKVGFKSDVKLTIGSSSSCDLLYHHPDIESRHAELVLSGMEFSISDISEAGHVYVNGSAIAKGVGKVLSFADQVIILGLRIIIGKRFISFNNPGDCATIRPIPSLIHYSPQTYQAKQNTTANLMKEEDSYFFRSPRIRRDIIAESISVEGPPAQAQVDEMPAILRIGPAIAMAMGSAMMGLYTLSNAFGAESVNILRVLPSASMVLTMLLGALLWPNLTRRYERRKAEASESLRRATYAAYLDKIRRALAEAAAHQREVFEENRISLHSCLKRVDELDRRLFERTSTQPDYLELRIGRGDADLLTTLSFPADRLSMDEDILRNLVAELESRPRVVEDVPLSLALQQDYCSGVVAKPNDYYPFLRGLIAQMAALHAPDEVKLVFFGDKAEEPEWGFIKSLPHTYAEGYGFRYIATDTSEAAEVSLRLERDLNARTETNKTELPGDYGIYYLVIVANTELAKTTAALEALNALRTNRGFSVLTFAQDLRDLPKECSRIIELKGTSGVLYDPKDDSGKRSSFNSDISLDAIIAGRFAERLAGIKLDDPRSTNALPLSLGFLEMFEVGKVEHLNIQNRWAESQPTLSLGAPLGVDPQGLPLVLDAHEDAHGPHGLFAGMTGSGKSETIITYILSMAVNYRPDEVSFVLIDYKGGGLAGAFDNSRARLPHLAGTITNLDGSAIARSLISIQSELKRRQAVFNQARDSTSSGTMDIYRYQELYRRGVVKEACPHLFIIADEFAELKSQQPDFMDQLISTARIGRSLGVHLLLATQKPSGVVNDQIWSNARFKICLKVADVDDSREMLKRPDAAELTTAGSFYLQVGYNEYFAMGQTGYSGGSYRPSEHFEPKTDDTVALISTTGRSILSASPPRPQASAAKVPEAVAVLDHLVEVAARTGLYAPQLWLDAIPEELTFDGLLARFPASPEDSNPHVLEPRIGIIDDPFNQSQQLFRLQLSSEGNALVYGATGSGKSTLLASMLYSLISDFSSEQLNIYLLDFGAETLGAFAAAPQVGDVVYTADEEKVVNLLRLLSDEIEVRRRLLSSFGGSLELYNKSDGARQLYLPFIVVAINNYDVFAELYEKELDLLQRLSRDGTRYGIYFIMTCSRAGSVGYRMMPSFKQKLALKLNSTDEYLSVFGSVRDVVIPDAYARGLIQLDKTYEFQTARLNVDAEISEYEAISAAVAKAVGSTGSAAGQVKARAIPALPDVVTIQALSANGIRRDSVPIGISRETFNAETQNFSRAPILIVAGDDEDKQLLFLEPFIEALSLIEGASIAVLDVDEMIDPSHINSQIQPGLFQDVGQASSYFERYQTYTAAPSQQDYLVIASLRSLVDSLDAEGRAGFDAFMKDGIYRSIGGLVISGDLSRFTSFSYESWYRELVTYCNGLWIGNGFYNQSTFKVSHSPAGYRDSVNDGFAWFVNRGNAELVKYLQGVRSGSKENA